MAVFTLVHVLISIFAICVGFIALGGMLCGRLLKGWTALFLATTIATSVTGFGFPFVRFLPAHAIGILSLVLLGIAVYALYFKHLGGPWRLAYIVTAVASQFFNTFVLVTQVFVKMPVINALAPTQSEPPFLITQLLVLVSFLALGILIAKNFPPKTTPIT